MINQIIKFYSLHPFNCYNLHYPMQLQVQRKKRTSTSGSRSKSKKSNNNIKSDQTVELKPKSFHIFHNQDISAKIKTQNSLSLNKNKGVRKNSKSLKRPQKQNDMQKKGTAKQTKDHSYLVSAQRKHSVNKIAKTEVTHFQSEDIFKKLYVIKKQLNKMKAPAEFSISEIQDYFNHIKESFSQIAIEPLQFIFQKLHTMYVTPIENFLNIIRPYQSILKRKQEIAHMIKQQIQENQKLYQQLDPQDIQIIQLKQKIKKNAELIQEMKKKKKLQSSHNISMKKKKSPLNENQHSKFIDYSNQESLISDRIDKAQFESKLVQEYEKSPVFQGEKKQPGIDKSQNQKNKSHSFTEALQTTQKNQNHNNELHEDKQQINRFKTTSQDEDNLDDEYLNEVNIRQQREENLQNQQGHPKMGVKSAGVSFSFKLDLPKIDRSNLGFHDQFYSKLDEFSESWRNQALREKRF